MGNSLEICDERRAVPTQCPEQLGWTWSGKIVFDSRKAVSQKGVTLAVDAVFSKAILNPQKHQTLIKACPAENNKKKHLS